MERKLDISAISFDDMLGEGLQTEEDTSLEDGSAKGEEDNADDDSAQTELEDLTGSEKGTEDDEPNTDNEEEEGEEGEGEGSLAIVNEIADTLGFQLEEEYEDSVGGLTDFVRDLSQQAAEDQLASFFEEYPDVKKHLDYVMSGGESSAFTEAHSPQTDFSALEIADGDTDTQRAVLGHYFQAKGHDGEFIQEMLDTIEDGGKLQSKALVARDELAGAQKTYREELVATQTAKFEQQKVETAEFWDNIANTIESESEFQGIAIPDRNKAKFFNYISKPVGKTGQTQRDIDFEASDIETKLAIDYLMYNGFELNDIIDKKARTKSTRSLRDRIVSNEQSVKNARKANKPKQFDVDSLDMTALLG
jgi:hypothetical protein